MAIHYYGEAVPPFRRRVITEWLQGVAQEYGKRLAEVTFQFCDMEEIQKVNKEFLGHNYSTDVITFGQTLEEKVTADILLCPRQIALNAEEYGASYEEELLRVLVHGVLHLCGFDDLTNAEAQEMRAAEERALKHLTSKKVWLKR